MVPIELHHCQISDWLICKRCLSETQKQGVTAVLSHWKNKNNDGSKDIDQRSISSFVEFFDNEEHRAWSPFFGHDRVTFELVPGSFYVFAMHSTP